MKTVPRIRGSTVLVATLCLCAGCRDATVEPPAIAATADLTPDQRVLLALDPLSPMYKVNAEGRVVNLRLVWRHLTPEDLKELGKLTELRGLDVWGTTLSDEGLEQLKGLHKLRSLSLGKTEVTDRGLANLEKLPALQYVWLTRPGVTQEAVDALKAARPGLNVYLN